MYELRKRGLQVESELPVPVIWEDVQLDVGFRADVVVEGKLVVELKSVEQTAPVHKKQLLTYLRLMDCRLGLLINFGAELIKGRNLASSQRFGTIGKGSRKGAKARRNHGNQQSQNLCAVAPLREISARSSQICDCSVTWGLSTPRDVAARPNGGSKPKGSSAGAGVAQSCAARRCVTPENDG